MTSLKKLYEAMETLREAGLSISEEQEKQISSLEEDIIKKDILPVIKQAIEPALKDVQREIVLVVDYKPGEPISVSLSRKTNVSKLISAKPIVDEPQNKPAVNSHNLSGNSGNYQLKPKSFADATEITRKFVKYMRSLNHSASTVNGYTNALENHIPRFIAKSYNGSSRSTFCYTDLKEVRHIYDKLNHYREFQIVNEDMHHEMSAALKKYIKFLEKGFC